MMVVIYFHNLSHVTFLKLFFVIENSSIFVSHRICRKLDHSRVFSNTYLMSLIFISSIIV